MSDSAPVRRAGGRRTRKGAAMILGLALTLCLTMLIVASQLEAMSELRLSRAERDFERALQMAEAGLNAYQHRLSFGEAAGQPGAALLPPPLEFDDVNAPSVQTVKSGILDGTYSLVRYPAGSQQGYLVGTLGDPGDTVTIVSYGWSNGVVRRVSGVANTETAPDDIEDDVVVNPTGEYSMYAVTQGTIQNNGSLNGGVGTNGQISMSNNCTVTNGVIACNGPGANATLGNNSSATIVHNPNPIQWPTVSQIATKLFPSGGLAWLATHNDNNLATINGVAGVPGNVIDAKNNVTIVLNSKVGGANYYFTNVSFKNNATIQFVNTLGPIRIWVGPEGGTGGFYSKNNTAFNVTSTNPANAPRLYIATPAGFTGKNNLNCNFGVYAYNEVNGAKFGHIEFMNNMSMKGTFIGNTVTMKNNASILAMAPFWQPLGGGYYDMTVWQE